MDTPITLYTGSYIATLLATPAVIKQETVWHGERCIVYAPAASLLSNGTEEISFALSEHVEQKKLTQEKERLAMTRRKKSQKSSKVAARQDINEQFDKYKETNTDESD